MEVSSVSFKQLAATSKQFARRLLTIGENRLELLTVEVQEERERLLHAILLAIGVAAFGLLAAMTLTAAVVVLLWAYSPVAVLLTLTALYAAAGFCLYRQRFRARTRLVSGRRARPRPTRGQLPANSGALLSWYSHPARFLAAPPLMRQSLKLINLSPSGNKKRQCCQVWRLCKGPGSP